jgi:hypothetical protein
MTKVLYLTKRKIQSGISGTVAAPSGMSNANQVTGTNGEMFNTNTGAVKTSVNIASSTSATPIVVTSSGSHGMFDGDTCIIQNHTVNTAANGTWVIKYLTATTFSLNTSVGVGVGGATGTISPCDETKRDYFYIPSGYSFASADIGRLVKITNSPQPASSPQGTGATAGTKKYDNWVFRIANVISSTLIQLEGVRFEDQSTAGSGTVNWTLMACAQFTSSESGVSFSSDPVAGTGGSCIDRDLSIPFPSSSNVLLKYTAWRIGSVLDSTDIIINDWTGNVQSFPTGSSLTWILHDRQAITYEDLYMKIHRWKFACGWTVKGAKATGTIVAGASPVSGDWITIWDGLQRRTWEWNNSTPGTNHTAVAFVAANANTNATNLAAAINGTGQLTAVAVGSTVTVTGNIAYARSNTLTYTNSGSSANSFGTITGMTGGADPGQFRGRNNGITTAAGQVNDGLMQDIIYFSSGELEPSNPKRMFLRFIKYNTNSTGNGLSSVMGFDWAHFQGWNAAYNNGTTHNPGNGINPLKNPFDSNFGIRGASSATVAPTSGISSSNPGWGQYSGSSGTLSSVFINASLGEGYAEGLANGFGVFGGEQIGIDYVLIGDKDELQLYAEIDGSGASYIGMGSVKEVNQNSQRFMVKAAATAGSSVQINVGPNLDPAGVVSPRDGGTAITIPYQVGDELQTAGLTVNASPPTGGAFIESGSITATGNVAASATNPDGQNFYIQVATLNKSYAVGDIVGEEAMPMYFYYGPHALSVGTSGTVRFQNAAQNNDATFFDWDNTGTTSTTDGFDGVDGFGTIGSNVITELNPNHRGGRFGLVPISMRNTNQGEFRGTMRYFWIMTDRLGTWRWIVDRSGNFYYIVPFLHRQFQQLDMAFGPVSQTQARP